MNSVTDCKEGVELAAFRSRMSAAKQKQIEEGQQVVIKDSLNERVRRAIQNARYHLLDLIVLDFHEEELRQIENLFIDLELKRLAELETDPEAG